MSSPSPLRTVACVVPLLACLLLSVQGRVMDGTSTIPPPSSTASPLQPWATSAPASYVTSSPLALPFLTAVSGCAAFDKVARTVTGCVGDGSQWLVVEGGNFDARPSVALQGSGRVYSCRYAAAYSDSMNIQCNGTIIDAADVNRSLPLTVTDAGVTLTGWTVTFSSAGTDDAEAWRLLGMSLVTAIAVCVVLALVICALTTLCVLSCCCGVSLAFLRCCFSKAPQREEQTYKAMA